MMFTQFVRRASMLCLLFTATATVGLAQQAASSFEELRALVKPGDAVTVSDTSGERVRGIVADLSATSLGLRVGRTRRVIVEAEVRAISRRRHGNLALGAKRGFFIAVCLPAIAAVSCAAEEHCTVDWRPLALFGGAGTGIGVGISALKISDRVIYAATGTPSTRLALLPVVTSERKVLFVSLSRF